MCTSYCWEIIIEHWWDEIRLIRTWQWWWRSWTSGIIEQPVTGWCWPLPGNDCRHCGDKINQRRKSKRFITQFSSNDSLQVNTRSVYLLNINAQQLRSTNLILVIGQNKLQYINQLVTHCTLNSVAQQQLMQINNMLISNQVSKTE